MEESFISKPLFSQGKGLTPSANQNNTEKKRLSLIHFSLNSFSTCPCIALIWKATLLLISLLLIQIPFSFNESIFGTRHGWGLLMTTSEQCFKPRFCPSKFLKMGIGVITKRFIWVLVFAEAISGLPHLSAQVINFVIPCNQVLD